MEKFVKPPKRAPEAPLRIPISGVYNIKGVGSIITGRLEQGTAKVGDEVAFTPCAVNGCKMFSMKMIIKNMNKLYLETTSGCLLKGCQKTTCLKVVMYFSNQVKDNVLL